MWGIAQGNWHSFYNKPVLARGRGGDEVVEKTGCCVQRDPTQHTSQMSVGVLF